ncbi:hypothetical protein MRB53_042237 [Persea americana]|nr:hypothetical protein MRB53_042237 [Persea americana]
MALPGSNVVDVNWSSDRLRNDQGTDEESISQNEEDEVSLLPARVSKMKGSCILDWGQERYANFTVDPSRSACITSCEIKGSARSPTFEEMRAVLRAIASALMSEGVVRRYPLWLCALCFAI